MRIPRRESLFLLTLLFTACGPLGPPPEFHKPSFQKVFIVVLENTNYPDALKQPFLARLAKEGALLSNYHGVAHPSQPNYIAMISGSTQHVWNDNSVEIDAHHLGDLLEDKGLTWKAYAEDYPGGCFLDATSGNYARKHVPFLSFTNVSGNAARCARIVNAQELDDDIAHGALATVSLYIPNLANDGHNTSPRFADAWLKNAFESRLHQAAFAEHTLFVVTFDESETYLGNQVYAALWGDSVIAGTDSPYRWDHYSLLRTVEETFDLGTLNAHDRRAHPISGVWK